MSFGYAITCPACKHLETSVEHRRQREQCSETKHALHQEYLKTKAYRNEQAALQAAKEKARKLAEIPFGKIVNARGVASKVNFS